MDKLLPCPFCGSLASDMGGDHCCCSNYDCALSKMGDFMTIHRDEWNTRHTPEGWQLVPVEPTEDMAWDGYDIASSPDDAKLIYRVMLAAAPKWGGE